ncbi:hypothetical protein [Methylobacterium symbioticum]|uniref:Holin of 3TMs, for gene-transfer release n=1 Tax=Methylobacterium symbioticum TaxID=2584084 RepID=A0A509EED3_9HYPH|nr:hypothetical protein [Methylobacterium symbioticum]VUD71799.1 hypothetical protein MET9862_02387 [Methylobacterium symbioticum]
MWAVLAKLVLGLPGVLDGLFGYLQKRSDNGVLTNGQNVAGDVTVAQAQLAAYVEERKALAAERAAQRLSPWTAWMIPTAFALCMLHFGAIVLDSTFLFNWRVAKLPAPYDQMEWCIVMAVIGVAGIAPTVRRIFGK